MFHLPCVRRSAKPRRAATRRGSMSCLRVVSIQYSPLPCRVGTSVDVVMMARERAGCTERYRCIGHLLRRRGCPARGTSRAGGARVKSGRMGAASCAIVYSRCQSDGLDSYRMTKQESQLCTDTYIGACGKICRVLKLCKDQSRSSRPGLLPLAHPEDPMSMTSLAVLAAAASIKG